MAERIKSIHFMPEEYPLRGSKSITYVHCKDTSSPSGEEIILYAGNDAELAGRHEFLLESAKIMDIISEDAEPLGGGHLDSTTLDKIRDSYSFGHVEQRILEELEDELREKLY